MFCRHRDTIYFPNIPFLAGGAAFPFAAGAGGAAFLPKRPAFLATGAGGGGGGATFLGLPLKRVSR